MAGDGAFWINGPTQAGGGTRAFPIMGWNFERGVGEAIHSWGHRAEATLDHVYRNWTGPGPSTWRRFTTIEKNSPGNGAVGNVHFPVNGEGDYDYDNPRTVQSTALDWKNYPSLTGSKSPISNRTWSPSGADPQREYLNWWYDLMPHVPGKAQDGYLDNWWRYLADPNTFKYRDGSLLGSQHEVDMKLRIDNSQSSTSHRVFVADTISDSVVGRVDFYVNNQFVKSDSIAPFVFDWNSVGAVGENSIVAKAYELVNGWEFVSNNLVVMGTNSAWCNLLNPFDVDGDNTVSSLDVLVLVNDLNSNGNRRLLVVRPSNAPYIDPDNDGSIDPLDVLFVINFINARGNGEGENSQEAELDWGLTLFDFENSNSTILHKLRNGAYQRLKSLIAYHSK